MTLLQQSERDTIVRVLQQTDRLKSAAAILGITPPCLLQKRRRYGLSIRPLRRSVSAPGPDSGSSRSA